METPYFVFKEELLRHNYKEFEELCKKYISDHKIAYSIKTNSYSGVIRVLRSLGSGFEFASMNEIKMLPRIGFCVYNSPCKKDNELREAIRRKALINIDSKSEIQRVAKIMDGKPIEVMLRVSFRDSKFGFDERELSDIIAHCLSRNLLIVGIHVHSGTQLSLPEYRSHLDKISILNYFLLNQGIKLKYLDIGGGLPDKFQLKNLGVRLEDYFNEIKKYLGKFNVTVILEPGRALVCDCFELITKVCVIKESFNKKYAILDAGINILSKITLSSYKFYKIGEPVSMKKEEYYLAGPLLFSNDLLGKYYGSLNEGDLLKVKNVGAYCYNLAWEISYKKPRIVDE